MSFDFLYDWFHSLECPIGYRNDFVVVDILPASGLLGGLF